MFESKSSRPGAAPWDRAYDPVNSLLDATRRMSAALSECGVNPEKVVVKIDNVREMISLSGVTARAMGVVMSAAELARGFKLHGIMFEVRTQPKVWQVPVVRELYLFDVRKNTYESIPNR